MARLFDGEVDVAYHQFSVETPELIPDEDVGRRFAGQTNGLCGAGEHGMLHCVTGLHTGPVPVVVDLLAGAPNELEAGWDEVVEVSLTTTTPTVLLHDWDHQHPVELPVGQGDLRVRYHASGMRTGQDADVRHPGDPVLDRYLLQVWPAPSAPDTVLRRTSDLAAYWHGTARDTSPGPRGTDAAEAASDKARLAAFHELVQDVSMSSPELQRAMTSWLAHRTARIAGPAATAWAQPALDALDRDQPLPAPFDEREAALAAAHRVVATDPDHREDAGESTVPRGTGILLNVVMLAGDPDPTTAVMGALAAAQHVNDRPESELHAELRAHFLPAAEDFLGLTENQAHSRARDRHWMVRVKAPGLFYTADYRPERVNIRLDERGIVTHADIG